MTDDRDEVIVEQPVGDADITGHLTTAMFVGVILLMLVCIYALANAA